MEFVDLKYQDTVLPSYNNITMLAPGEEDEFESDWIDEDDDLDDHVDDLHEIQVDDDLNEPDPEGDYPQPDDDDE
ncbi:hypothetical protein G7092_23395 [Mucilaginibacter sp. HC2]|uniref:hypothetical protein n=1 Tax=Mucilaginibacter inviolabilis TaxID=2714892 RepID=UPI00140ABBBD|nr:hypothetical protein [Mucilaginibacter inviolabilis]NHA06768.1 hypothetical protein [Mucilaginibacter inviolabilis]